MNQKAQVLQLQVEQTTILRTGPLAQLAASYVYVKRQGLTRNHLFVGLQLAVPSYHKKLPSSLHHLSQVHGENY